MEQLQQAIVWTNSVLSDYVLTVLLVGCGVFFTIRTRFVQFRCLGEGFRNALGRSGGAMMKSGLVWELQDLLNQLMVLPNAAALIALSGIVAAEARRRR